MGESLQTVELWLYSKNLLSSSHSSLHTSAPSEVNFLRPFQHWAVVAHYLDDNGEVVMSELYEAFNEEGYVVAYHRSFSRISDKEWMSAVGAIKELLGRRTMSQETAIAFCREVTNRRELYSPQRDNCQKFVEEFIIHVTVEGMMNLPTKFEKVAKTLINSSANIAKSSATIAKHIFQEKISNAAGYASFKEMMEKAGAEGIRTNSLLAKFPQLRNLIQSFTGEIAENMINACRGAFSWWNLLQIPVEVITPILLKKAGFSETAAYGGSKMASVLTAAGVGLIYVGPVGLAASVAVWIAAEITAYLFRKLLEWVIGDSFTFIFGESQTELLVRSIYDWIATKYKLGMKQGIEWMNDYINANLASSAFSS